MKLVLDWSYMIHSGPLLLTFEFQEQSFGNKKKLPICESGNTLNDTYIFQ